MMSLTSFLLCLPARLILLGARIKRWRLSSKTPSFEMWWSVLGTGMSAWSGA